MTVYERETRVAAQLEEVWTFHSRIEGLEALTPPWMNLCVESVRGPDGNPDPETLVEGTEISMSVRPFGVGPRQGWTSRIVTRQETEGAALFRDEMTEGPFARWVHTHAFYADGSRTRARDRVEYELPGGGVGRALSPLALVGFEPMFRYRHRRTHERLAGGASSRATPTDETA